MALWKRFWLLISVIWAVVCLLDAFTLYAFGEGQQAQAQALQPLLLAAAGPVLLYGALWGYFRLRAR
jgi:hypothetical protein